MDIMIVAEDTVSREIAKRLLNHSHKQFNITREEPVRGGEIKQKILNYNKLGLPVFTLADLDTEDCPITLINDWFGEDAIAPTHLFRVAYFEAEAWLMSDIQGFAKYLEIDRNLIPGVKQMDRQNPDNIELSFKYKPSLFLMHELVKHCKNPTLVEQLSPKKGAKKGPQYNSAMIPFIQDHWNIDVAAQNSFSLKKALQRIHEFNPF